MNELQGIENLGGIAAGVVITVYVVARLWEMFRYRNGENPQRKMVALLERMSGTLDRYAKFEEKHDERTDEMQEANIEMLRRIEASIERMAERDLANMETLKRIERTLTEHDRWERGHKFPN